MLQQHESGQCINMKKKKKKSYRNKNKLIIQMNIKRTNKSVFQDLLR